MIHNNLSSILTDRKLTQEHVADRLGITRQYFGSIVAEKKTPSSRLMFRIARYFNMSIADIFYADQDHQFSERESAEDFVHQN